MLFYDLLETTKAYPEKTALVYGSERLSYTQLSEWVAAFMERLRPYTVGVGDSIVLLLPNSLEFVISFYAIAGLRANALPLNPLLKEDELKYYLKDNDVKAIVTDSEHEALCRSAVDALDGDSTIVIAEEKDGVTSAKPRLASNDLECSHALFEGPVICQYSSGTTERAKKVCRTQRQLRSEIEPYVQVIHLTAADTVLCVVPLFHTYGLVNCMLSSIATGAKLVILEQGVSASTTDVAPFVFRSQRVFELIAQERVSVLPGSPYIFGALAETPEDMQMDVSSLRICLSAGNLLPEKTFILFKQRFGLPLRPLYGSTETGAIALNMEPDEEVRFDSIGRPYAGVELQITDETLHEFPAGTIGEIAVRAPSTTAGYLDQPELNREKFKDGFFFMGDLGKKDEQGRLYVTGRKKTFIDSGGEKVDPQEVEQILLAHPAVAEAVVVGIAGPYGSEAIKAVLVVREAVTELDLLLYCRDRLSDYKVPRVVEFRQALPRNVLGKLIRQELIAGANLTSARQKDATLRVRLVDALLSAEDTPQRLLSQRICEQIAVLLHLPTSEIDALRPLGELGLGSLMAVELRDWLEASLQLTIPITLFWSYPTALALATHLLIALRRSLLIRSDTPTPVEPTSEIVETQRTLYEVEQLSDAEVQQQLESIATALRDSEAALSVSQESLASYAAQIAAMSEAEVEEALSQEARTRTVTESGQSNHG